MPLYSSDLLAGTSYASVIVSGADPELTAAFVTPVLI